MTHVDSDGKARMVDVGEKKTTVRRAVAEGKVIFGEKAFDLLLRNRLAKGDAVAVARLAGIQAAKRTAELIPLCHIVPIDHIEVSIDLLEDGSREATVRATVAARWVTGVEMEAMVAVSAACMTLYDMAKGIERGIEISGIRLLEKSGGRSGTWRRS